MRGLKYHCSGASNIANVVAPHVGAWIEITTNKQPIRQNPVAPHVGAWIEITTNKPPIRQNPVAPHVGAWIEIQRYLLRQK